MVSWLNSGVTPQTLERALARLERWLAGSNVPEALVARREAGRATSADRRIAADAADALLAAQGGDGSWRGSLVATAEALLRLSELTGRSPPKRVVAAAARGVEWLRGLRGRPGRYGDGCSPERHRLGICHHFLGGFFAPEPPIEPDEELVLAIGARFPAGPAARLAASCLALQASLRWGAYGPDAQLHLDGLRRLFELDGRGGVDLVGIDALPAIVLVLLEARDRARYREMTVQSLARLTQIQRADGSWPELDALYILDVLLAATGAGLGTRAIDAAIRRGAGMLAITQQDDGLWERNSSPRRALIGWRALRYALGVGGGTAPQTGGD